MKKIISALVIGAAAAGIATADLSLTLGSKLAGYAFQHNTDNLGGFDEWKTREMFNLNGYDGTGSDLKLTAKGNIFTFYTHVGVASDKLDNAVKAMTIAAKVGAFQFTTGWNRSGITNMATSDPAKGNEPGFVTGEAYKLGSGFGGPLAHSNTQSGFGKDADNYFGHVKYGFGLGDTVKLNLAAAVLSPHGVNNSEKVASGNNVKAGNVVKNGGNTGRVDNTQMGWGVNVNPVIGKIVSVDLFAKGYGHKQSEDGHNFLLGGYAKLLCVPILTNAIFGGSVWLDGDDNKDTALLQEWNVDLDLAFAIGDRLKLGFNNKFAFKDGGAQVAQTVGRNNAVTKPAGEFMLWDVLSVQFKLNDTLAIQGSVGQQTAFGDNDGLWKDNTFTVVYVNPRVQVFASSAASVSAGAVVTFAGLGRSGDAKMALLVDVPFIVKIAL